LWGAFDAFFAFKPKHVLLFVIPAKSEIQIRNVLLKKVNEMSFSSVSPQIPLKKRSFL